MGFGFYLINPHWLPVSYWKRKKLVQFPNVESETEAQRRTQGHENSKKVQLGKSRFF